MPIDGLRQQAEKLRKLAAFVYERELSERLTAEAAALEAQAEINLSSKL